MCMNIVGRWRGFHQNLNFVGTQGLTLGMVEYTLHLQKNITGIGLE